MSDFKDPDDLATRLKAQALKGKAPSFVKKVVSLECWPEVCEKLSNSENIKSIAEFVQSSKTQMMDYTRASFIRQMYMFCEHFSQEFGKNQTPNSFEGLINTVASKVDPLDSLHYLLNIQADRLHSAYLIEKKSKKLDDKITNNVKIFMEIARSISSVKKEQTLADKPAGNDAIDPVEQVERQKRVYEEKLGEMGSRILNNPDSRKRVLHLVEMVMASADGKFSEIINVSKKE